MCICFSACACSCVCARVVFLCVAMPLCVFVCVHACLRASMHVLPCVRDTTYACSLGNTSGKQNRLHDRNSNHHANSHWTQRINQGAIGSTGKLNIVKNQQVQGNVPHMKIVWSQHAVVCSNPRVTVPRMSPKKSKNRQHSSTAAQQFCSAAAAYARRLPAPRH